MFRILVLIFLVLVSFAPSSEVDAISSTTSVFQSLGIVLTDPIADTYYTWDAILIRGRVTDGQQDALIYLKNISTGESISELAETTTTGEFSYPLSFPRLEWNYSLIIASGNSFSTTIRYPIELVANRAIAPPSTSVAIRPVFSPTPTPYLSIGSDIWATMTIEQGKKTTKTQGKILSLADLPLQYWAARLSLQGYRLTSPSSLDRLTSTGVSWTGSVYIDRTRDMIGRDVVSLRVLRWVGTMQFRIPRGKQVNSRYYLTTPSGDVIESEFAPQYVATGGYLRTGVNIRQSFSIADPWVYKIEAVSSNWYAYFNLPISRSQFWSIRDPITDIQKSTLRTDLKQVQAYGLKTINELRIRFAIEPLILDQTLSDLAQHKANDMAKYEYVRHDAQNGMYIQEFAASHGIKLSAPYGENVAWWQSSDINLQDGLEESGSHRHSMLGRQYSKIGIGYAIKNNKSYLVQVFGK